MTNKQEYVEKRKSRDRRVCNDPNYTGAERRTGIDSRGWKKVDISNPVVTEEMQSNDFDWFEEKK